ncbi:E2 protein [Bos taurus papillomavirus 21]|uniref:Regulatory protein E2 n=1 Tax=Bos taurus papillomavirus 21 TaxID=1887219 RepID=A0A1B2K217_9PAPI|nr:E2 protein [Bos taurus papillomavirus 21]ANZ90267.1 E2 protein [Bos taurus papillomavirus 21]
MESLADRFEEIQELLLDLYEAGKRDIQSQIIHWDYLRKESVLLYYARQRGLTRLGLNTVPVLQASEIRAKNAIMMGIILRSLANSEFGGEDWTLQDTSIEMYRAPPQDTFKKQGSPVEVMFDGDPENINVYTNWGRIYYQDTENNWRVAEGQVSYDGLYYDTVNGQRVFFVKFDEQARTFSKTGSWRVKYKNKFVSESVSSSSTPVSGSSQERPRVSFDTDSEEEEGDHHRRDPRHPLSAGRSRSRSRVSRPEPEAGGRGRRRRRQGEGAEDFGLVPEEVGSGHRTVPKNIRGRLARLQAEAADPPVILVRGSINSLKSWRHRCNTKHRCLFQEIGTTFVWSSKDTSRDRGRVVVAFRDEVQLTEFLRVVPMPKSCSFARGHLDSL